MSFQKFHLLLQLLLLMLFQKALLLLFQKALLLLLLCRKGSRNSSNSSTLLEKFTWVP